MIAARLMMARALAGVNPAWIAGGALIVIAIVIYAIVSSGKKEGYAPYSPTKYPHWGLKGTKNEGLRCKFNNNTGCTTKWEGGKLVDLETPSAPAPSSAKKKDGESCTGGNQCQSGLCSKEKRCYSWKKKDEEKKKDGESCTGGNQCQSGLCSKEKRCYSLSSSGCKFSWQTKDAKGKCVGCPPDRPVWDSAKKTCVAKSASGQNCEWFQKLDSKGRCVGCPPDKPTWDNAKKACVAAPSSATLDVVRKYPYWGLKGTKNEGLKCKNKDNTGCTTKWVKGRLVDLEKPTDVCPFAWQTKNEKGQCVGCPPDKPKWDKVAKACTSGCKFTWQVRDSKGKCVGCPPDKPTWDNVAKACTSGCKFTWQVRDSKGKCVGCPPDKPTWDNAKKACVASPVAAPVSNLTSIPAPVDCKDPKHWVKDQAGIDQCLCKDPNRSDGADGSWCTVNKTAPLDCKDPKHWVGDQCLCKDPNRSDGADGSWCTVNKAEESWNWRKNQCAKVGGYVCSEKNVAWNETPQTGNPNYIGADVPNQCCVDTEFDCGGGGVGRWFKNMWDAGFRTSKAWSPDNKGCNVDVYRATDLAELGKNNRCGGFLGVAADVFPPTRVAGAAKAVYDRVSEGDSCSEYVHMDPPQELPSAVDFY